MLIPCPKKCLESLDALLPDTIKVRCEEQRRWLTGALKALNKTTGSVEDFVEQSNSLNRVQEEF
jgi:hypothetical protein